MIGERGTGATMRKMLIAVMAGMCSVVAFSRQLASLPEIVSFMSTNDDRLCFVMTNSLDSLIASTTGGVERSTCKLLMDSSEDLFPYMNGIPREILREIIGRR